MDLKTEKDIIHSLETAKHDLETIEYGSDGRNYFISAVIYRLRGVIDEMKSDVYKRAGE